MKKSLILSVLALSTVAHAETEAAANRCWLYSRTPERPVLAEFRVSEYRSEEQPERVQYRVDFSRAAWNRDGSYPRITTFRVSSIDPLLVNYAPHFKAQSFAQNKGHAIFSLELWTYTKRLTDAPMGEIRFSFRENPDKTLYGFRCDQAFPLSTNQ
jgi:hypothetical protein